MLSASAPTTTLATLVASEFSFSPEADVAVAGGVNAGAAAANAGAAAVAGANAGAAIVAGANAGAAGANAGAAVVGAAEAANILAGANVVVGVGTDAGGNPNPEDANAVLTAGLLSAELLSPTTSVGNSS